MSTEGIKNRGDRYCGNVTIMRRVMILSLLGAALINSACSSSGTSSLSPTTVSGSVVDGPVKGATIRAFEIKAGNVPDTTPLATATTASDGSYSLNLAGNYSGSIVITATGGSYCAGSSTAQVTNGTCSEGTLTVLTAPMATVAQVTAGSAVTNAYVTPISTAAMPLTATVDATGTEAASAAKLVTAGPGRATSGCCRSSETICPSRMVITRSAQRPMSGSWVTRMMVMPEPPSS